MIEKRNLILILFLGMLQCAAIAQTCTIKISEDYEALKRSFGEELEVFFSIEFEINRTTLTTIKSDSIRVRPNEDGFDNIRYTYTYNGKTYKDSFICRLLAEEVYTISPCTCCGIFLMTPSQQAERGFVQYINKSKKMFIANSGDLQLDTLFRNKNTGFILSSISMNCGFRPNTVFIADLGYLDEKFDYENWKSKPQEEQDLLDKEQQSYVVFSFNYLFLHKEQLVVTIDKSGSKFDLKLDE
jgi:hypothetical protein